MHRMFLLTCLLALLASACQLRIATDLTLDADGSGTLELALALDNELLELLTDAGFDPRFGLGDVKDEALGLDSGWTLDEAQGDEGLELRFHTTFARPERLGELIEELHEGLEAEDASLFRSLDLSVGPEGELTLDAVGGLELPDTTGARGSGVAFDGDDLAALLADRGDELIRFDLAVSLPNHPVEHDADARRGNHLTWRMPIGGVRSIHLVAVGSFGDQAIRVAAAFLLAAALGALIVVLGRPRIAPSGRK